MGRVTTHCRDEGVRPPSIPENLPVKNSMGHPYPLRPAAAKTQRTTPVSGQILRGFCRGCGGTGGAFKYSITIQYSPCIYFIKNILKGWKNYQG